MAKLALVSVYCGDEQMKESKERFLYDLLEERKPWESVSHKDMPSYKEHIDFIDSKPYKKWYIIDYKGPVGAIYLTKDNEIGIFIERRYQKLGYGSKALKAMVEDNPDVDVFYANIAPYNSKSLAFFCMQRWVHHKTDWNPGPEGGMKQYVYKYSPAYDVLPKPMAQSS